jgi:hypothetical protein
MQQLGERLTRVRSFGKLTTDEATQQPVEFNRLLSPSAACEQEQVAAYCKRAYPKIGLGKQALAQCGRLCRRSSFS